MQLGAFSISLNVSNIHNSKAFYEKLGFSATGGNIDQGWVIMKNGSTVIGLFHGMFEGNILTFNPGWDQNAQEVNPFTDVREIQSELLSKGIEINQKADQDTQGPAHFVMTDPDGNSILVDQHR